MARARSSFRNWIEYGTVRLALATMSVTPRHLAFRIGAFYAIALDRLAPRLRRIAYQNLLLALPELTSSERERIVNDVFASIGRIFASFARFPQIRPGNLPEWIRCDGLEHVHAALARGRGILFVTAHIGNWELSSYCFAMMQKPMGIVVRPLDNPLIDTLVDYYREMSGNWSIDKREYARGILQALGRNEMVGILADQHTQDGIPIQFFGQTAWASTGLAKIAARTGAAAIPGCALWSSEEQKYVLRFFPEVPISGEVASDTQSVQSALESIIRRYPDQWLWIHRRWKAN